VVADPLKEVFMQRTIAYRNFEIHVELTPAKQDTFDVSVQIGRGASLAMSGVEGRRIALRNGPFTERWAYLIAEVAGQAAIDVILGPAD